MQSFLTTVLLCTELCWLVTLLAACGCLIVNFAGDVELILLCLGPSKISITGHLLNMLRLLLHAAFFGSAESCVDHLLQPGTG